MEEKKGFEAEKPEEKPVPGKGVPGILPEVKAKMDAAREEAEAKRRLGVKPEQPIVAPTPPPKPTQLPEDAKEIEELEKQCSRILKEHGGQESNVPVSNEYWGNRNRIRYLNSKQLAPSG